MRHRICEKCGNNGFTTPQYRRRITRIGVREALVSHCLSCGFELREPCKDTKTKKVPPQS